MSVKFWMSSARKFAGPLLSFFSFMVAVGDGAKKIITRGNQQTVRQRKGIVFVTANYRLYPEVRFPAFPEGVALASAWVRKNVRAHGGDGNNLFLMGHSAGAHSACLVGLDPVYLKAHGGSLGWIRGVVSMSAPYEFDPGKEFLYRDLFPPSVDRNSTMPAFQVGRSKSPSFFTYAR